MGYIYRLNSFCEWELEGFPNSLYSNSSLQTKGESLEYIFAILLQNEDELFLFHKPNLDFLSYLSEKLNKEIKFTNTLLNDKKIIEWGIFYKKENNFILYDKEIILLNKKISSKINQGEIRKKFYPHLPNRVTILNITDLEKMLPHVQLPVLLKPDYSLSEVGSYVIQGKDEYQSLRKSLELKLQGKIYFLEDWKEKIFDFTAICDSEKGFICLTKMNTDYKGTYLSSEIFFDSYFETIYQNLLENLEKNNFLPKGKFSIDGFV